MSENKNFFVEISESLARSGDQKPIIKKVFPYGALIFCS